VSAHDKTGRRAAVGAVLAAVLCALPPVLFVVFGVGVLAYLPSWLDLVLVPLFLVLLSVVAYRWLKGRSKECLAE